VQLGQGSKLAKISSSKMLLLEIKFSSNSKYLVAKVMFSVEEIYSLPIVELTFQNKRETESEVRDINQAMSIQQILQGFKR
jgi:hypothetical protein